MSVADTLKKRGSIYGHFKDGAEIMQHLKSYVRSCEGWERMSANQKEAMDMILHKMGRVLNGDPNHADSWHDIGGYATLAEKIINGENP